MKKFKKTEKYVVKPAPSVKSSAKVVGSAEQEAIWKAVASTPNNLIVRARAGTGKTFTSIQSLYRLAKQNYSNVGFVAFNRSIAEELAAKIPENYEAKTLHGLGYRMLRDAYGRVEIMKSCKTRFLLKKILATESVRWDVYCPVQKLVSLVKGCGDVLPNDVSDLMLDDLCVEHELEIEFSRRENLYSLVRQVLQASDEMRTLVDFDDMIRLPLFTTPKFKYDVLFVDEAQDLNRSQQQLAMLVAKRLVLVGDNRQSIYGFRGADTSSLANMQEFLEATPLNCSVFPLTESRRCPRSHVLLAQSLVPDFRYLDTAVEGTITQISPSSVQDIAQPGDLIVSRVNTPLVRLAYLFLQRNVRVRIQGRDFSKNLISLIRSLCPNENSTLVEFLSHLENYRDRELLILSEANSPRASQQVETLNDKCDCLVALCEGKSFDATVRDLISQIESLFADEPISLEKKSWNYVLLSSVHRAKGLEARNVFVLTGKMPIPFAKTPAAVEQEMNIIYVAITRSLENLYFVGSLPPCLSLPEGYIWEALSVSRTGPMSRLVKKPSQQSSEVKFDVQKSQSKTQGSFDQERREDSAIHIEPQSKDASGIDSKGGLYDLSSQKNRQAEKQDDVQGMSNQGRRLHARTPSPSSSRSKSSATKARSQSTKVGKTKTPSSPRRSGR